MSPQVNVTLFGIFELHINGTPLSRFATERGQALLAYLLLNPSPTHTRAALAELFWPEQPHKLSRQNLRQTLSRMRRDLQSGPGSDPFGSDYHTIQFDASLFSVDALRFQAILHDCQKHAHAALDRCAPCAARLHQAVALYGGELLMGLSVDDSPAFEEWLLLQREVFHRQVVDALQTLIRYHRGLQAHATVRPLAAQLIALEPYQESAYAYLIEALALLGEREAALAQYDRCLAMLTDELGVAPGQELTQLYAQLNHFRQPEVLMQAVQRQLPKPGKRYHFPQFLVPFFGRQMELAHIVERLADPSGRLFTVTGPGGMGKSRLIVEAAQHLNPLNYPDGLYFVPLAAARGTEEVIHAIADALSIPLAEGGKPQQQLLRGLAKQTLLLVLDNFEQLMESVPLILEILQAAPAVTCLVSSRHPLQIEAEWQLLLDGLDYPSEAKAEAKSKVQPIEQYSAVAFFLERARRTQPNFKPTDADLRTILEICQWVKGMPLAISMAASWLSIYDCATIAAQISQSLDFFATPLRDLPARHQNIRATFEISWQLLPDSAQQTLARLSIFHDTFSQEAIERVAEASPLDLMRLISHSLVTRVAADRFTIHGLIRQFCAEKLTELGDTVAMRRAHSRYYLARLAAEGQEIVGTGQFQAIGRLRLDLPNLRAAWVTAGVHGDWVTVQQSQQAFARFWSIIGMQAEGQRLAAEVRHALAGSTADPAFSAAQQSDLLARLQLIEASFAYTHAPLAEVVEAAHHALALAEEQPCGAPDLLGEIHLTLSWLYHHQGRRSQVEHHLNEAYQRLHTSSDYAIQSRLYMELSALAGQKGDLAQRLALLEKAVVLAEQSGDLMADFMARRYLVHIQNRSGDFSTVRHHLDHLLHNARLVKNVLIEAQALNLYAGYYYYLGDFKEMATYNLQCYPLLKKAGNLLHLSIYYMRKALHALFTGNETTTIEIAQQTIQLAQEFQHLDLQALASILMGRAYVQKGELAAGWDAFARAMQILDKHGRSMDFQTAVLGQATILLAQGKSHEALAMIEPYLPEILTGDLGIVVDQSHVYADVYRILCACDDPRAAALLARARAVLTRIANTIPNAELRQSFWQSNPSNRLIQCCGG